MKPVTQITRYRKSLKIKPIHWVKCKSPIGHHQCWITSHVSKYDAMKQWNAAFAPNTEAHPTAAKASVDGTENL
jgi:hypothetical protein